jgi:tetratricopeptide (TPR) repeat protein
MPGSTILRIFLLIILSSLFAKETSAQRDNDPMAPGSFYEVSGQVRSADNRTVENVMVRIESSSGALVDQGEADSMGRFRFIRLRSGQYRVSAKAAGVISQAQSVDLSRASPRVHVLLQLLPEAATFRSRGAGRAGIVDVRVPVEATAALERGRAAIANKKPDEAIAHLQKAAGIYPDFYEAHMLLGQLYMDGSQWQKAEYALRQALKSNPKAVMAMTSLGEVYRRQKKYGEGQKLLEEALKLDANSWESNFTLGRIHWELNDIVKAGRYVARSIELQPNVAEAHLLAGNIFIRAGLPGNALIEYEEYLRLAPKGEFAVQTQALVDKLKKSLPSK